MEKNEVRIEEDRKEDSKNDGATQMSIDGDVVKEISIIIFFKYIKILVLNLYIIILHIANLMKET